MPVKTDEKYLLLYGRRMEDQEEDTDTLEEDIEDIEVE